MACETLIPYTGVMPKSGGLTVEEEVAACVAYRTWHQDSYIPWLEINFPTICSASDMAATLFDTSNYQGVYDAQVVYSLGQSASVGDDIYISNTDSNGSTPPSASWVLIRSTGAKLSDDGLSIVKQDGSSIKNQVVGWVSFDGTATPPTINDSFNVSSVANNSLGKNTLTLENNMDDLSYVVVGSVKHSDTYVHSGVVSVIDKTLSTIKIQTSGLGSDYTNYSEVMVFILGGKA